MLKLLRIPFHYLKKGTVLFCFLTTSVFAIADEKTKKRDLEIPGFKAWAIVLGYNGFRNHLGEVGFGKFFQADGYKNSHHGAWYGYFGGIELGKGDNGTVLGTKFTAWFNGGVGTTFGLTVGHHTNFERGIIFLRPEIGFGIGYGRIYYGYNAPIGGDDIVLDRHRLFMTFNITFVEEPKN